MDLHGQHTHQSLLSPSAQRQALDQASGIDASELSSARQAVRSLHEALENIGGDAAARAREIDVARYQLAELDAAELRDSDEDRSLREQEAELADVAGLRESAIAAWTLLNGEDGVSDVLARITSDLAGRAPLDRLGKRLASARGDSRRRHRSQDARRAHRRRPRPPGVPPCPTPGTYRPSAAIRRDPRRGDRLPRQSRGCVSRSSRATKVVPASSIVSEPRLRRGSRPSRPPSCGLG